MMMFMCNGSDGCREVGVYCEGICIQGAVERLSPCLHDYSLNKAMARKRLLIEMGMGTDLRGQDYTKAAVRALKDALWHNSVSIAPALGYPRESMEVDVEIGVSDPDAVNRQAVADVLPYGRARVNVVKGGLDIVNRETGNTTVMANAVAVVYLDIEEQDAAGEQA